MAKNDLRIKIEAELDESRSKQNIKQNIKELENTPFYLRLIAKLNKALSKSSIKKDLKSIENDSLSVKVNGKLNKTKTRRNIRNDIRSIQDDANININTTVNQRALERSVENAVHNVENNVAPINIPVNVNANANINNLEQPLQDINNQVANRGLLNDYFTARDIFRLVANSIKEVIDKVGELNKAQTDLQIATSKSNAEMKSLMADYNQLGKQLSSTTLDITGAADDWLRQGHSVADTNELIKDSLILSKIGQIESSQSTEYLTSAMKGFKTEAKDVISIVDKLSAVDLQSASSAGGLAEAMSKCANSASTAGISMDSLIGYIATVAEVTQKSDAVVGESFKTIIARMGKIKLNDWIDEDGNDISGKINDVEKTLGKFNIALRESATEFRDFEDVFYDVGMTWEKFSKVDKNAVANAFGGVYQRENVITLFNNFSRALELTEASANSAGTAMEKFSIYENSLEAATNRLTASLEGLAYNTIDADFLKGLANATAGIVEFMDKTKLLKTGLTAAIFTGAVSGLVALGTRMIAVRNNVVQFTQAMNISRSTTTLTENEFAQLSGYVSGLSQAQLRCVVSSKQLTNEQRIELLMLTGLSRTQAQAQLQTWRLTEATNAQRNATFSLRGAWEALKASIAVANPIGLIVTALTTATTIISAHNQAQEEATQKLKEQAEQAKQLTDDIADLRKQYYELSKEVETDSSKKEQLNSVTEELLKKLGYEKSAVADLVEEYGNLDDAINSISLSALEDAETDLKFKYTASKNNITNMSGADSQVQLNSLGTGGRGGKISQSNYGNTIMITSGGSEANLGDILKEVPEIKPYYSLGILQLDVSSVEKTKESIDILNKAIDSLEENIDFETLSGSDFYNNLNAVYKDLTNNVKEYDSAVSNLNDNLAQQFVIKELQGNELPKSKEEFDTFADSVVNASIASEQFIGSEKDIKNSVMAVLQTMPEFSSFFTTAKTEIENTGGAVYEFTAISENLSKALDNAFGNQSVIQSAFDKIQKGSSLSADEMLELIDLCHDLYKAFKKTADGYTISADDLISANERITESAKQETKNQINTYKQQLESITNQADALIKSGNYSGGRKILDDNSETIKLLENAIGALEIKLSLFGITSNVTANKYTDMADTVSNKTKLITSAIDEMNDVGHISASTYAKIAEMGGNFADCLEMENGQLVLNVDKLKDLETQEYKNAISANKLAIAHRALRINSVYDYQDYEKFKEQLEEENAFYQSMIDEIYGANGSENKSKGDPIKEAFEKDMAEAEHLHNMGLMSDEEYWKALEKANNDHYKNSLDHQSEYNTNLEKIFNGRKELYKNAADDEASFLDEQLEKGFITAEEYKEKMIGLAEKYYGQGSKYYDTDFATENFELLEDKALKADDQIYEDRLKALKETEGDSLESHNEFIADWKALNEEIYEAPNPKKYKENLDEIEKYDKEYIENRNKKLANDEKSYWEWQKEQVETYYDNELKKLQEITDQEERISKQKELQLKLMKAQDDLLKAKKNRNQLVFSNGGWEYDYNQDDIISKIEAVADAEKDIADNQKENQKDDLEKQKEEALAPFEDLIKAISDYIDKLNGNIIPTESNKEVLDAVVKNAEQVQKDDKKRAENFTPVTLESFLQDMGFKYNKEVVSAGYNLYEKVIGNSLSIPNEIAKSFSGTTYNNCTINKGISINNTSLSVTSGYEESKVRDIFDEEITNALNTISDRIETEAIRVANE